MQNRSYTSIAAIAVGTLAVASFAPQANAAVVITEVFYNLKGTENANVEWIEIYNTGTETVDLTGWRAIDLADTDSVTDPTTNVTAPFVAGTTLAPGQAKIILSDPSIDFTTGSIRAPYNFAAVWGPNIELIAVPAFFSLANGVTAAATGTGRETPAIIDASNNIVDQVSYLTVSPWPAPTPEGTSIYLKPGAIDAASNDIGTNWGRSVAGADGAFDALIENPVITFSGTSLRGPDTASPGVVIVPEPMSLSLIIGAATLGLARRRRSSR